MRDLTSEELEEFKLEGRWRRIKGYEEFYLVSDTGEVFSIRRAKKLKPAKSGDGYLQVYLCVNGKVKTKLIHRLIAKAFIFNPHNYPIINHLDGMKTNNNINNLEWCTSSENNKHAFKMGFQTNKGSKHPRSKLKEEDIWEVLELLSKGETQTSIAKKFGVDPTTISMIKTGLTWSHLTGITHKSKRVASS